MPVASGQWRMFETRKEVSKSAQSSHQNYDNMTERALVIHSRSIGGLGRHAACELFSACVGTTLVQLAAHEADDGSVFVQEISVRTCTDP